MLQALYLNRHTEYFMYSGLLCKVILTSIGCSSLRTTNKKKRWRAAKKKLEFQSKEYRIIIWISYKHNIFFLFVSTLGQVDDSRLLYSLNQYSKSV